MSVLNTTLEFAENRSATGISLPPFLGAGGGESTDMPVFDVPGLATAAGALLSSAKTEGSIQFHIDENHERFVC